MNVLIVNVHFHPNSFGGATVVAEKLAVGLVERHGCSVSVLTTHVDQAQNPYDIVRYNVFNCIEVYSVNLPPDQAIGFRGQYENDSIEAVLEKLCSRSNFDVLHFHSIQRMGVGLMRVAKRRSLPYVITVHDAWWFCERQFMIDKHEIFCQQKKVGWSRCSHCVNDLNESIKRREVLDEAFGGAAAVLCPSQHQLELYKANYGDELRLVVSQNGVSSGDAGEVERLRKERLSKDNLCVFGFVGGPGALKGGDLIRRALATLDRTDYKLVLVNSATNRNEDWSSEFLWHIGGRLEIVSGYRSDEADKFYASIDVLLHPSQCHESFGLSVREASARGVWVITSDSGGASEAIIDGVNGNVMPLGNEKERLKELVTQCIDNHPRSPEYTIFNNAEAQADETFDLLRCVLQGSSGQVF